MERVRVRLNESANPWRHQPGEAVARLSADVAESSAARILPSACTATERTLASAFGLNESAIPWWDQAGPCNWRLSAEVDESSAHQNFAVRLHGNGIDRMFGLG